MNLMKLFNLNYLKQNLKKSKVVLSIFIGLIPILNTIILTMLLTTNNDYILGFAEISIINLIGIYILPIIISICLFNYVYKKKTVDFINSMPISRKSIFITNTILGIIIFILMLLVNIILISILTTIFSTTIPLAMLIDYFWFFLVVYIFCYTATNLAMTVSGNAITQIVVTLLLLFLVPFTTAYTTALYNESTNTENLIECTKEECMPENYYCYDNLNCSLNKQLNRYNAPLMLVKENNYTTPFGILYGGLFGENNLINTKSTLKMIILSVIYIITGYRLFLKRKMEVSETSFKNIHIHNLVKSLTIVPMIAISYLVLKEQEIIFTIFILVIILVYYFVYDLITRKNIQKIRLSLLYFVSTITLLVIAFSIIDKEKDTNNIIKYNDIKSVSINLNNNTNTENKIYINNKELISIITKQMLNESDYNYNYNYFTTYLKTKDNKEYRTTIRLNDNTYNNVINILSKEKEYLNYYKNIDTNKVYAIKLGNKIYSSKEGQEYLNLINNSIKKLSLKEFLELQKKYNYTSEDFNIILYTYENHDKQELSISGYIDYNLLNIIVNSNNKLLKDNITKDIPNNYYLYYDNSYIENEYKFDYYVLRMAKEEIYNFILKDLNNEVDMKKEYITLSLNIENTYYKFTTNNIEELLSILDKKYNEIKDTTDYQEYIKPSTKESVVYYD